MAAKLSLSLLAAVSIAAAQTCPLQFEGRIPADATPEFFDESTSLFNTEYNLGADLKWSQVIVFPEVEPSLFDTETRPFEITINDDSIFAPSPDNVQTGFRRAELLPMSNDGSDPSTEGIKTLHFSLQKDMARPLNLSHEYQLVFVETADYSTNQFALKTGTLLDGSFTGEPDTLILQSNVASPRELFSVAFAEGVWHNFALVLNFEENTTQVYYSANADPLESVGEAEPNDLSGRGQYHFGILKKPTGEFGDMTREGYQPSGIDEGVIYGGIFMEDSVGECVSLAP
ncbi:hypothetical protein AJ79_06447 [Helicocarpus griseus UAMH5409]|uniref:Glycoside hydrolase 131 catalytic N-terminal domain-containing protein n=1 Tax=Helicocarpus griseus UAMH5409 TaxID=1447875 RepID=A0A2B7XCW9_9EURO|nr:hypothetical protein AJ79_06447 [Helicocarpus griseus UAMH5409]